MERTMNDKLMEAAQVLIENGMSADDAYVALQAQCYILWILKSTIISQMKIIKNSKILKRN